MTARLWLCALVVGLVVPGSAAALTTTYTDEALFLAALPGPATTLDFESLAPGTLLPSGSTLGDLALTYSIAVGNGIVTVENRDQAWARASVDQMNKGGGAASAALEMIKLKQQLGFFPR